MVWLVLWTVLGLFVAAIVLGIVLVVAGSGSTSSPPDVGVPGSTTGPAALDEPTDSRDGATETTQPAIDEALLTVDSPQVGSVFVSGDVVAGETTSATVEWRLTAGGDQVLAGGTATAVEGTFSAVVEFTNTCCIEMLLEVTGEPGLTLSIPLAYPEPS